MIKRRSTCPNCGQEIHSESAVILRTQLADATATALTWRARYMASVAVLEHLEDFLDHAPLAGYRYQDAPALLVQERSYSALRAAFLAFRAIIEAGAPVAWEVAEVGE